MKLNTTAARVLTVAGVGIGAVALIGGTATAASLITAKQMATGSVNSRVLKDQSVHQHDLAARKGEESEVRELLARVKGVGEGRDASVGHGRPETADHR